MNPELTLVMPAYNEEECIEQVVRGWLQYMGERFPGDKFKMLVINDGSKDSTPDILNRIAETEPQLEPIHQPNGGHGKALLTGYRRAIALNPDYVFQVDSDDQFVPEDFDKLWAKRNESKFILGYREKRYDEFNRLIITRILRAIILFFFWVYIKDSNVPYRLIDGEYLKKLLAQLPGNPEPFAPNIFVAVLAKRHGQNLFSIPVTHKERETGTVSIVKWNLLKVCFRSARELFNFSWTMSSRVKALD